MRGSHAGDASPLRRVRTNAARCNDVLGRRVGIEPYNLLDHNQVLCQLSYRRHVEPGDRPSPGRYLRAVCPRPRRRSHPHPASQPGSSLAVVSRSGSAEDVGIEPTQAFRPQLFSRQRPSPALGWVFHCCRRMSGGSECDERTCTSQIRVIQVIFDWSWLDSSRELLFDPHKG